MSLKIEVIEPGIDAAIIDIEQRTDKNGRVTVGRPLGEGYPHHIRLSKATGMVSAIQMTLEIRGQGDDQELWVRDGGMRTTGWKPSTNKTRLGSEFLAPTKWYPLRVGDVIRIGRPGNIELAGFAIKHALTETVSGTFNDAKTTSYGAVEVWHAESLINDDGVLLLRKLEASDQLIIEKMDYGAEDLLGGQPGELINLSGRLLLETLINERDDLELQVRLSMQQRSPVPGLYTGMKTKIKLTLRCNEIDGRDWFLGYVSPVVAPEAAHKKPETWQQSGIEFMSELAKSRPVLFGFGLLGGLLVLAIHLLR